MNILRKAMLYSLILCLIACSTGGLCEISEGKLNELEEYYLSISEAPLLTEIEQQLIDYGLSYNNNLFGLAVQTDFVDMFFSCNDIMNNKKISWAFKNRTDCNENFIRPDWGLTFSDMRNKLEERKYNYTWTKSYNNPSYNYSISVSSYIETIPVYCSFYYNDYGKLQDATIECESESPSKVLLYLFSEFGQPDSIDDALSTDTMGVCDYNTDCTWNVDGINYEYTAWMHSESEYDDEYEEYHIDAYTKTEIVISQSKD